MKKNYTSPTIRIVALAGRVPMLSGSATVTVSEYSSEQTFTVGDTDDTTAQPPGD